jgi:hypothetical protein
MRCFQLLLPLSVLALTGCVAGQGPPAHDSSAIDLTPAHSATYMTSGQSENLITMPGDSTTAAQMRYLSNASTHEPDSVRPAGL